MNDFIIQKYINNISLNNISEFAKKEEIILEDYEVEIIYNYLKKYWKIIYYEDPKDIFNKLKKEVKPNTYNKIIQIYKKYKRL